MLETVTEKMINYFGSDIRRINHAIKVQSFANLIIKGETLEPVIHTIVDYAAILHDISIKEAERKYGFSKSHYQEKEGAIVAKNLLKKIGIYKAIIERVCFIIAHHHTYDLIDGIDFQTIVEADFIVNIHECNINKENIEQIKQKLFNTTMGIKLPKYMYKT